MRLLAGGPQEPPRPPLVLQPSRSELAALGAAESASDRKDIERLLSGTTLFGGIPPA